MLFTFTLFVVYAVLSGASCLIFASATERRAMVKWASMPALVLAAGVCLITFALAFVAGAALTVLGSPAIVAGLAILWCVQHWDRRFNRACEDLINECEARGTARARQAIEESSWLALDGPERVYCINTPYTPHLDLPLIDANDNVIALTEWTAEDEAVNQTHVNMPALESADDSGLIPVAPGSLLAFLMDAIDGLHPYDESERAIVNDTILSAMAKLGAPIDEPSLHAMMVTVLTAPAIMTGLARLVEARYISSLILHLQDGAPYWFPNAQFTVASLQATPLASLRALRGSGTWYGSDKVADLLKRWEAYEADYCQPVSLIEWDRTAPTDEDYAALTALYS